MTNAEAKDEILKYCLNKFPKPTGLSELHKKVLPSLHADEISLLLVEISKLSGNVANVQGNDSISSNGITKNFLKEGGFTKIEKEKESRLKLESKHKKLEIDLAKSNIKANKLNKKIAEQNRKNKKLNNIMTVVNIIIGILNVALIAWQILKD